MPAEPFPFIRVADLLDRIRALQRATAAATAAGRATFDRLLQMRAAMEEQIGLLRWADGCPATT
jgi:hypothetical protein